MEFVVLLTLSAVASVSSEAVWSEWKPLGICLAKPCNCHPTRKDNVCNTASIIEVRYCNRTMEDAVCSYDDGGPLRIGTCTNNGTNCPGWSDWIYGPCDCTRDSPNFQNIMRWKECNNPKPMFESVKCQKVALDLEGKETITLDGEVTRKEWFEDPVACPCPEPPTTTTTTTMATTPVDCDNVDEDDEYAFYGQVNPCADEDYGDYGR